MKKIIVDTFFSVMQRGFEAVSIDRTHEVPQGPVLVVVAHSDDEALGAGVKISQATSNGVDVHVVVVTDGNKKGHEGLAETRRNEALEAGKVLGLPPENYLFLSYPDGQLEHHARAIEKDVQAVVARLSPALVISHVPFDGNPDHRAVSLAVAKLQDKGVVACPVHRFPIWYNLSDWLTNVPKIFSAHIRSGNLLRVNAGSHLERKHTALSAYVSQFTGNANGQEKTSSFLLPRHKRPSELYFVRNRTTLSRSHQ